MIKHASLSSDSILWSWRQTAPSRLYQQSLCSVTAIMIAINFGCCPKQRSRCSKQRIRALHCWTKCLQLCDYPVCAFVCDICFFFILALIFSCFHIAYFSLRLIFPHIIIWHHNYSAIQSLYSTFCKKHKWVMKHWHPMSWQGVAPSAYSKQCNHKLRHYKNYITQQRLS